MKLDQADNQSSDNTDAQGKHIASLLNTHANRLSMRTLKQLEDGRALAVKAHAQQLSAMQTNVNQNGTLTSTFGNGIFSWAQHHRIASTGLVLATIIAGFIVMQSLGNSEPSDAFLLGADLPPEAFVDRGFEPSLNSKKS